MAASRAQPSLSMHCAPPIVTPLLRLPPAGVGSHLGTVVIVAIFAAPAVAAAASQLGVTVVVVLGTAPDRRLPRLVYGHLSEGQIFARRVLRM